MLKKPEPEKSKNSPLEVAVNVVPLITKLVPTVLLVTWLAPMEVVNVTSKAVIFETPKPPIVPSVVMVPPNVTGPSTSLTV